MRKAAALLVTLCVSALPVDAKDAFQVIGAGVDSCGTWTAESRIALGFQNKSWVLGYVTGYNRYGLAIDSNVAHGTNAAGIIGWIDNYCRANPLDSIAAAAESLVEELRRRSGVR
jgi:hypothetical protein